MMNDECGTPEDDAPEMRGPNLRRVLFIVHHSAFLVFLLGLAACAKVGEPRPPLILIPQHTTALTGMQKGEKMVLRWPLPARNTNGTPVTTLQRIDIYRLVEARADQPAPLSAEAFAGRAQRIGSIAAADAARWMKDGQMTFEDDPALLDRSVLYQRSFRYAVTFVNDKKKADGFSNFFLILPIPIPASPRLSNPTYTEEAIDLSWDMPERNVDGSRPPKVVGFNIFRSESPGLPSGPPLNHEPISDTRYNDRAFEFGKTYYYSISVVGSLSAPYAESLPSAPQAVHPIDTFPPKPPADVNLFPSSGEIRIVWATNSEPDLAGYTVYRSESSGGEFKKLTSALIPATTYKDTAVVAGRPYYYYVTATDRSGNESRRSEVVSEVAQ